MLRLQFPSPFIERMILWTKVMLKNCPLLTCVQHPSNWYDSGLISIIQYIMLTIGESKWTYSTTCVKLWLANDSLCFSGDLHGSRRRHVSVLITAIFKSKIANLSAHLLAPECKKWMDVTRCVREKGGMSTYETKTKLDDYFSTINTTPQCSSSQERGTGRCD